MHQHVLALLLSLFTGVFCHEPADAGSKVQDESPKAGPTPSYSPSPGQSPGLPKETNKDLRPDNEQGRCGPLDGSCREGLCCSIDGLCGSSEDNCAAPDCQYEYGSGCDALRSPRGRDTSVVARPRLGNIPYGPTAIYECVIPNTVALTYDDGPNIYTSDLLDILDSYRARATFFVTAVNSNKGQIDDTQYPWYDILHRMSKGGHQIASHTWSHQDLDRMSPPLRRDQMIKNEMALRNALGFFPTYMRPPYSSCNSASGCLGDMEALGYHIVYYDVDTDDYNNDSPDLIQRSKDIFDSAMATHKSTDRPLLVIAHDVHEQTVYNLTRHMLQRLYDSSYVPVTLGECLGDPPVNWYRSPDDSGLGFQRPGKAEPKQVSADGACGDKSTCTGSKFGVCCSGRGYCGSGPKHCGEGCQETAGACHYGSKDETSSGTINGNNEGVNDGGKDGNLDGEKGRHE